MLSLTMSVEALRVQFFNTIREFAEEYIGFSFREAEQPSEDDILRPTYVPQGYHESDVQYMQSGSRIIYRNDDGERITLSQFSRQEKADLRIDNEYVNEPYTIYIGACNVTVYEQCTDDYNNYIIYSVGALKKLTDLLSPVITELRRIEYYINLLPDIDNAVLTALYLDKLTYKETASKLSVDTKTIVNRRNQGLSELASMYSLLPED